MEITFENLKNNFEERFERSNEKEQLIEREIECYSYVLNADIEDYKEFLNPNFSRNYTGVFEKKFYEYSQDILDRDIFNIKSAYIFFIVNGLDRMEAGNWYKNVIIGNSSNHTWQSYSEEEINKLGNELVNSVAAYFAYLNWLKVFRTTTLDEDVIPEKYSIYVDLLFEHFKLYFTNETNDSWRSRFFVKGTKPKPIYVSKSVKNGSDRLILIAILETIRRKIDKQFDYQMFVLNRFGIKAFYKTKSDLKENSTYLQTIETCETIYKRLNSV